MNTSWWIEQDVQRSYPLFHAAAAREFPRMSVEKTAWLVDSIQRASVIDAIGRRPTGSRWGTATGAWR